MVKNPGSILGPEDPLEKGMTTHSSILALEIPWMEGPGRLWGLKESDTIEWLTLWTLCIFLTSNQFCFQICCLLFSSNAAIHTWVSQVLPYKGHSSSTIILVYLYNIRVQGSVQFSRSVVSDSATPWTAACQASLSITNSRSLLKLIFIQLVMPSNHFILCHLLLLLPSILPSIRVFSNESVLRIKWPKNWSINFSISPSNEYSELIFFRIDWFDLLAVQGTLKGLL